MGQKHFEIVLNIVKIRNDIGPKEIKAQINQAIGF